MSSLLTNLKSAIQSLREQKQRAMLSALGITVGSMAIVLLISIAQGIQKDVGGQVESLGVNLLVVLPGRISEDSMFAPNLAGLSYLKDEDVERVRKVPGVRKAAPLMFVGGGISYEGRVSPTTFIIAAGPDWFDVHQSKLAEGRFFTEEESDQRVSVIGSIAKTKMFGDGSAVGKPVEINGETYTVVGVTQDPKTEDSLFSMGGFENMAYVPYKYAQANFPNPQLHRIMIQTQPDQDPETLEDRVDATLAERLDRQQFTVLTQQDLLEVIFQIMGILTWLLTGLTSIALFVGGVGIMTVMLMAVNERTKEIGVRKTVGARRKDIFTQFLTEAVFLTSGGATLGLLLSYVACLALYYYTPVKPLMSAETVALTFAVSIGVGTVFGLIPAMKAARQDPVVALRNE